MGLVLVQEYTAADVCFCAVDHRTAASSKEEQIQSKERPCHGN